MTRYPIDDHPRCITCQHFRTKFRKCIVLGNRVFIDFETASGTCKLINTSKGDEFPRSALFPPLMDNACRYKPWVDLP